MADNALPPGGVATLPQWWRQRCTQWAAQPALRHKRLGIWTTMDWSRYFDEARALGLALDAAGLQPGEVVSILSHNRPEWLCMDLAAQAMGFVSHGLYPSSSGEEVAHALQEAGTRVLLVENAEQLMKALQARGRCPALRRICVIDDRGLRGLADPAVGTYAALVQAGRQHRDSALFEARIAAGTGAQIAALIGTAGTTAPARLAAVTQQALLHQVQALQAGLGTQAGDHSLSFAPLAQADERLLATGIPLVAGGLVHFAESPGTVFNDLREAAPHWVSGPPRFWERLHARTDILAGDTRPAFQRLYRRSVAARRPGWIGRTALRRVRASLGLARVRLGLVSAASLSEPLAGWYRALGLPLAEVYGLAESCGMAWLQTDGAPSAPRTEVRLTTDGEILLRGPAVLAGYWSAGTLQAGTAPADGWFATGDLGAIHGGGSLRIVGRRSERVEAAPGDTLVADELERLLRANAYVSDAMLVRARRAHCTCVLALEPERVFKYAQDHHVPYTDYAQLVAQPEIQQLIAQQLEALNAGLPAGRRIHRFAILPKVLNGHDEELTPQLRLRRRVIESRYAGMIDGLYA